MQTCVTFPDSSAPLRQELSKRNLDRANRYGYEHEATYGEVPSVLYRASNGAHGNFLQASYRSICANPKWRKRLEKSYCASRRVARSWERNRFELDCANSSDALLMNIFCYPNVLQRRDLCTLLGIEPGIRPAFGIKPRVPILDGRTDRTEMDMCLGDLFVEAKLTETGFQTASAELVARYRDLREVFELEDLPIRGDEFRSYQLIRGVLGAYAENASFLVLCDSRRSDLIEHWFHIMRAVRSYSIRNRLKLLTWQEIANTLPRALKLFLADKYGIFPTETSPHFPTVYRG